MSDEISCLKSVCYLSNILIKMSNICSKTNLDCHSFMALFLFLIKQDFLPLCFYDPANLDLGQQQCYWSVYNTVINSSSFLSSAITLITRMKSQAGCYESRRENQRNGSSQHELVTVENKSRKLQRNIINLTRNFTVIQKPQ